MNIRLATIQDLDEVISMGEELQNDSRKYEPRLTFDREASFNHYKNELQNPDARIIVACDEDGLLMGYQYSYKQTVDHLSDKNIECVIEALYVLPICRGRGIGLALVKDIENYAISEWKVNRFKANIYSQNEQSISLHKKEGFIPYCTEFIKYVD